MDMCSPLVTTLSGNQFMGDCQGEDCPCSHLVQCVFICGEQWNLHFSFMWCFPSLIYLFLWLSHLFLFFLLFLKNFFFLLTHRDLLRIGVTLAGHQKKILGSIQDMRLQMNQTLPVQVWVRRRMKRCSRRTARQKKGEKLCQRLPLEKP